MEATGWPGMLGEPGAELPWALDEPEQGLSDELGEPGPRWPRALDAPEQELRDELGKPGLELSGMLGP